MSANAPKQSGDDKPLHSHSGDEPKPQGAFKTVSYDEENGAPSVEVTPPSKAATAMAAGEPVDGKSAGASADDLDSMSVADLHARATELNIEGRSQMDKAELQKAIRKASK